MAQKSKQEVVKKLKLLGDQPIGEGTPFASDGLGFRKYADVLGAVAVQTPGPFTVGIFGEWGTGKTSLMRLIEDYLSKKQNIITVWFNAWRFESEEQPIVPLVATIVRELERNRDLLSKLADGGKGLIRGLRAVAYGFSGKSKIKVPGFAEIEASFVAKDMIERAEAIAPDPLLEQSMFFEAFKQLSEAQLSADARIVVLIDDLDRCFPDKAIKLLESIKLVLAQPGFIFFLGVARHVIEGYLQHKYKKEYGIGDVEGNAYLDKIVQLPFHIPPHRNRMSTFWDSVISRLDTDDQQIFKDLVPIIGLASGSNPRSAVRFVNNLLVDRAIYKATAGRQALKKMPISFFAVSRSMQQRWPGMFSLLCRSKEVCTALADWATKTVPEIDSIKKPEIKEAAMLLVANPQLKGLLDSDYGKIWLADHSRRGATIDFLQTERSEVLDKASDTGTIRRSDVVLTYCQEDAEDAVQIEHVLAKMGLEVCSIYRSSAKKLFPHESSPSDSWWANKLRTEIPASGALVVLIGRSTKENENIACAVGVATSEMIPIIPVLLPRMKKNMVPFNIRYVEALHLDQISVDTLAPIGRFLGKWQKKPWTGTGWRADNSG